MKTKQFMSIVALLGIFAFGISPANSQETDYHKYPGYVDFGNLNIPTDAEERVEIFLESPILKFMSKISAAKEPEFARFLEKIILIKANIFNMSNSQKADIGRTIENISKNLKSKNWQRTVSIKDDDAEFEIYMLLQEDKLNGLAVMGMENNENAIFINIVGEIDPEQLGKLSQKFNIPELDNIHIH